MTAVLISTLIILAVAALALAVFARREAARHGTDAGEELAGICKTVVETASQKETRKQKVLALLAEEQELSNSEIRRALGVSSRTAVRYMNELEEAGKVKQVGEIGRAVTYRLQ